MCRWIRKKYGDDEAQRAAKAPGETLLRLYPEVVPEYVMTFSLARRTPALGKIQFYADAFKALAMDWENNNFVECLHTMDKTLRDNYVVDVGTYTAQWSLAHVSLIWEELQWLSGFVTETLDDIPVEDWGHTVPYDVSVNDFFFVILMYYEDGYLPPFFDVKVRTLNSFLADLGLPPMW